jgi:hypothetical protein
MNQSITRRFSLSIIFTALALSLNLVQNPVLGVSGNNLANKLPFGVDRSSADKSLEPNLSLLKQTIWPGIAANVLQSATPLVSSAALTGQQTMPTSIIAPSEMAANSFEKTASDTFLASSAASVNALNPVGASYSSIVITYYTIRVDVEEIATGGGYVQIGCDQPSLIHSPTGSWPFNLSFPANGSLSQYFSVSTSAVTQSQTAHIYACEEGGDIADPNDWRVIATVTVVPTE